MKQRILLVAAMLLLAVPAFATVTINVTQGSGTDINKVYVDYSCSASEKVRAFALDLTLATTSPQAQWAGIQDFNKGESTTPGGGYGIFPGQFRSQAINPADPNWNNAYYYPIAPTGDVDSNGTGIGTPKVICELGTLYKDANAPGTSGRLFTLVVDNNSQPSATLTIATNTVRGGVVLEDGTTVTPTINTTPMTLNFISNVTISGQIVGSKAPRDTGLSGINMVVSGTTVAVTNSTGNYSFTVSGGSSGTVTPTDPNNQWTFVASTYSWSSIAANATYNVTATATECMNASATEYSAWKNTWNKPSCWCYKKQCRGDINGASSLGKPVTSADLSIFKSAYSQANSVLVNVPNGICADLNHAASLSKQVTSADLGIFKSYYSVAETSVPICPSTYINAWTN